MPWRVGLLPHNSARGSTASCARASELLAPLLGVCPAPGRGAGRGWWRGQAPVLSAPQVDGSHRGTAEEGARGQVTTAGPVIAFSWLR